MDWFKFLSKAFQLLLVLRSAVKYFLRLSFCSTSRSAIWPLRTLPLKDVKSSFWQAFNSHCQFSWQKSKMKLLILWCFWKSSLAVTVRLSQFSSHFPFYAHTNFHSRVAIGRCPIRCASRGQHGLFINFASSQKYLFFSLCSVVCTFCIGSRHLLVFCSVLSKRHHAFTLIPRPNRPTHHHRIRTSRKRNSRAHSSPPILRRRLSQLRLFSKHNLRHYSPLHWSNNHPIRLHPQRHHPSWLSRSRTMYV